MARPVIPEESEEAGAELGHAESCFQRPIS